MQALLLPLADDWYALELRAVREVLPAPGVTRVPRTAPAVLGVFNARGEVVPLVDTSALLGLGPGAPPSHVVVVDAERGRAGLAADRLPVRAELGDPAGPAELAAGRGRFAVADGGVATLLDPDVLLAGLEAT